MKNKKIFENYIRALSVVISLFVAYFTLSARCIYINYGVILIIVVATLSTGFLLGLKIKR